MAKKQQQQSNEDENMDIADANCETPSAEANTQTLQGTPEISDLSSHAARLEQATIRIVCALLGQARYAGCLGDQTSMAALTAKARSIAASVVQ